MSNSDSFYQSNEWRSLRARRLLLDNERCTVARLLGGECRGVLHVHHIATVAEHPELRLDIDNTGTACAAHHATWEAIARTLRLLRVIDLPPCRHNHRYDIGREECRRRRRDEILAKRAGKLAQRAA